MLEQTGGNVCLLNIGMLSEGSSMSSMEKKLVYLLGKPAQALLERMNIRASIQQLHLFMW